MYAGHPFSVQWLRLQKAQVQSLAGDLRSVMTHGVAKNNEKILKINKNLLFKEVYTI